MAKNALASSREALGDELCLPTAAEEATGTELPKPASSEGFEIPRITMLSASVALPDCRQLGILQGSGQEFIQPSQQQQGRVGDLQPHSAPAQADTGGLIHPSGCHVKGGWGHLKGCPQLCLLSSRLTQLSAGEMKEVSSPPSPFRPGCQVSIPCHFPRASKTQRVSIKRPRGILVHKTDFQLLPHTKIP